MLKLSKVINEETKEIVFANEEQRKIFESEGFSDMEVEQAYNGSWYVAGYAPEKPESIKLKERAKELHKLLDESDWVASKITDLMILQPEGYEDKIAQYRHILEERQLYRDELNKIENNLDL